MLDVASDLLAHGKAGDPLHGSSGPFRVRQPKSVVGQADVTILAIQVGKSTDDGPIEAQINAENYLYVRRSC